MHGLVARPRAHDERFRETRGLPEAPGALFAGRGFESYRKNVSCLARNELSDDLHFELTNEPVLLPVAPDKALIWNDPSTTSNCFLFPIPGTLSSKALPPSAVVGLAATETYSTHAVLEVHLSWPLLGREPDPATPRAPHPAPTPALALLLDNSAPASKHPADPFSRDPRISPAPMSAP